MQVSRKASLLLVFAVSVYPWPSPTSTQTLRSPSNSPQPARTTTLPNLEMCSIAYAVSIKFASGNMRRGWHEGSRASLLK